MKKLLPINQCKEISLLSALVCRCIERNAVQSLEIIAKYLADNNIRKISLFILPKYKTKIDKESDKSVLYKILDKYSIDYSTQFIVSGEYIGYRITYVCLTDNILLEDIFQHYSVLSYPDCTFDAVIDIVSGKKCSDKMRYKEKVQFIPKAQEYFYQTYPESKKYQLFRMQIITEGFVKLNVDEIGRII